MTVLVIGGMGFVGRSVIKRLMESGENPICFDIFQQTSDFSDIGKDIKVVQGDMTCIEDLIAAIQKYSVGRIIHLAVQRQGLHSAMRISALGTNCVFEAARLTGLKKILFASSIAFHGPQSFLGGKPVVENDHGSPTITYGAIKWMNEFMAKEYNKYYGMEIVAVRVALAYGLGHRGGLSWANDIMTLPAMGKPVAIPCRSNQRACLIHVEDVAEIFTRLIRMIELSYDVYHTGGDTCTLEEMAGIVKELIPDAQIAFEDTAEELAFAALVDNSRLRNEIGFQPRSLRDGISQVINTIRERKT